MQMRKWQQRRVPKFLSTFLKQKYIKCAQKIFILHHRVNKSFHDDNEATVSWFSFKSADFYNELKICPIDTRKW